MDTWIAKYVDAADLESIKRFLDSPDVSGYTTNPTLMRKAGISDYLGFAKEAVELTAPKPISLEVFSDTPSSIYEQALRIAELGENVFVKVPVTTTSGGSLADTIHNLSANQVKLNVTAILTNDQVSTVCDALDDSSSAIISVFAGRIADSGVDPMPIMSAASKRVHLSKMHKLLWASPREILNLIQAQDSGCDIITMTPDLWVKIANLGRDLEAVSLETVRMFYNDAKDAGYEI